MNAISKKLLSMLVVMAMVLSMVPFGGLSIFAVETEATEVASATVTPGQANLPDGISTTNPVDNSDAAIDAHIAAGTCPMCNQTDITWVKKTGNVNGAADDQEQHYYYELADGEAATTYPITTNILGMTNANSRMCIAVKSGVTLKTTKYRAVMMASSGNTLNIMGTGAFEVDTVSAGNDDFGAMQLGGGSSTARNTVNLYGCTFTHVTNQDATNDTQAIIRINASTVTVNMWDGAIIGPATVDTTKWGHNVRVDGGIFNMYGGTIRNGVSKTNGISGNVTIANSGKMYMYGGTISGGNYSATGTVGGNVVVGGRKQAATSSSAGSFYMYGGTITGGSCANGGNGGGNIVNYNGNGDMHLLGGIIENGNATWGGGNVSVQAGTAAKNVIGGTVLIRNGTITGSYGANVVVKKGLTMSGGFIQGDSTVQKLGNGGGICLYAGATLNMTGGEISNMNVAGTGGAIYAAPGSSEDAPTTVTIGGTAVLDNNQATTYGGSVHLNGANCILNVTGGTIKNGHTTATTGSGGNLSGATGSTINVSGGSIFGGYNPSGNAGASWGGNIRSYQGTVNISGGYIYNGYAKDSTDLGNYFAGNIGVMGSATTTATLNISGGHIGGDIGFSNTNVKLSGAPEIKYSPISLPDSTQSNQAHYNGIAVGNNSNIDISELTTGAQIQVTGSVGAVFTAAHENAANVVDCFSCSNSAYAVDVNADNALYIVEAPEEVKTPVVGTFNPWECEGMAYCDACLAQGKTEEEALVEWTVYAGGNSNDDTALSGDTTHYHLYLDADQTYSSDSFLWTYRKVCFNLNGHDVTAVAGASSAFGASASSTINLMDTEGGAVVTGYKNVYTAGAALHVAGANAGSTINIYGGTYTKLDADTAAPIVQIAGNGGTINMYEGATIDATGKSIDTSTMTGCAVTVVGGGEGKHATFNMEGGEIKGGDAVQGGAVMVGRYSATIFDTATFNLKGGKISGGTAHDVLNTDSSVKTAGAGGNFSVHYGGVLNISGGTLCNGTVTGTTSGSSWGGNIRAYNGNVNISGGLIYGGSGGKNITGANVSVFSDATGRAAGRGKLHISGGTIVGDVAVSTNIGSGYLTLSGAPTIVTSMEIDGEPVNAVNGGLYVSGYTADISGLSAEADIALTAALNVVFTDAHENAANVVGCFKPTNAAYTVEKQADNTLKVVEAVVEVPSVDKFEPGKFDGMAYCPVCYANGTHTEPVAWTAITASTAAFTMAQGGHYYLSEDITNASVNGNAAYIQACGGSKICCLNLNGKDLTVTDGRALFGSSSTFNIMDTEGGAVVTGSGNSAGNAATLLLNSSRAASTVNLYGGTFTKAATSTLASIVCISSNGGTINMYDGAVIDGTNLSTTSYATGVYLVGGIYNAESNVHGGLATFNMHGGEIKNGATAATGGNINVGSSANNAKTFGAATFNMYGGKIYGGKATTEGTSNAGNVLVQTGGVFNMTGGEIYGGEAANQGGNFRVFKGDLIMSGDAVIKGGTAAQSANIWLVDSDLIMSGNAQVLSPKGVTTKNGSAVNAAQYQIGSRIILSGNATVKGDETDNFRAINLSYNATLPNVLLIDNGWTGEAYLNCSKDGSNGYASGDTMSDVTAGYCGELDTETMTVTKGGTFSGTLMYNSTKTGIVGSNGDLIVSLLNVGDDWFTSYNDALAAYYANGSFAKGEIFTVNSNATLTLNGDIYIESRGYTVTLDGTGNLYALDRANDDYVGYGLWNVTGSVKVVEDVTNPDNGNRYIVIKNKADENNYSSHRIEVKLTAGTLRASEAGLYYKASYKCDGTLAGRVSAYGVAVSTNVTPGADFLEDYTNNIGFSCLENFNDVHETTGESAFTVNATSGSVFGIFKTAAERPATADLTTAQLNAKYGKMKIYANTYFLVDTLADEDADNDYVVVSDTENGGTQNGIGYSLWDALVAVDGMWNELGDKQALIEDFYNTWKNEIDIKDGVEDSDFAWDLTQLPNIFAALSASN